LHDSRSSNCFISSELFARTRTSCHFPENERRAQRAPVSGHSDAAQAENAPGRAMGRASKRISTSSETMSLFLETGFESSQRKDSFPKAESAFGYVKNYSGFYAV
jgi:hypothetical protein